MVRNLRATVHAVVEADCPVRVAVAAVYTVHVDVRVVHLMHRTQQHYIKWTRWRKVVASNKSGQGTYRDVSSAHTFARIELANV